MLLAAAALAAAALVAWFFATRLPANYPPTPPLRLPLLGHALYFLWHRQGGAKPD